ncbi:alpha/beta fold hydrolase [Azohydromonas australica]|uniref:alpha/beta fold hydrolase n=1 Tax=Azohydromonas australica TaxID=364039 RepID=UPI0003FA2569|nr:alpha/beta fold hydrolase [Azohydromonas australica]
MGIRAVLVRMAGVALLATSLLVAVSHAPERPPQTLVERWGAAPSRFMEVDERVLHLRDEGPLLDPQPLVMLHGLGGSLHDWEEWSRALRNTHRVIRIDLPGNGLSDPAREGNYRSEADARRVLALLSQLGVERMRLVGHGHGGEVAAQMALQAPRRVTRLLLVSSAPQDPETLPLPLRVLPSLPLPQWLVTSMLPRLLVSSTLDWLYAPGAKVTAARVDRRQELLQREGNRWALLEQWRQRPSEQESQEMFSRLKLPVLLLWGNEDSLTPLAEAQALRSKIPGSRLLLLSGVGHLPQEEAPARSLAAVQPFLEGH